MKKGEIFKQIEEKLNDSFLPIDILKALTGGLSPASVFLVDYGETSKLGVLKIGPDNEVDSFNKVYNKAKENGYHHSIANLVVNFEIRNENGSTTYVSLYELAGDSLDEITYYRLLADESVQAKAASEKLMDFMFKWNKKHERAKLSPIENISNCLLTKLNDQKYRDAFSLLTIPENIKWLFLENTKEFIPNPFYFLSADPVWKNADQQPIEIHCFLSLSHGDFHSKNVIFSNDTINIIDIGDTQENTNVFYDLAYMELHTLMDLYRFENDDQIQKWIDLTKALSHDIRNVNIPYGYKASILREFINTLRKGYNQVIGDPRNTKYDTSFYLAGVAAGINFFRKTKDLTKKYAAFIYASFFLKAALEKLGLYHPTPIESLVFSWNLNQSAKTSSQYEPTFHFEFIPMGAMVSKDDPNDKYKIKKNRIFLDTGNMLSTGVIDLHQSKDGYVVKDKKYSSTTGVIANSPNFLLDNLEKTNGTQTFEIIVHHEPDLDCFASAYIAKYLVINGDLPKNVEKLVEYVEEVDSGLIKHTDGYLFTPYAIASAIQAVIKKDNPDLQGYELNKRTLERGIELIEYLMDRLNQLRGSQQNLFNLAILFEGCPFDREFSLVEVDYKSYEKDRETICEKIHLNLPVVKQDIETKTIKGLVWNTAPTCLLHKHWARREGYIFTFIPSNPRKKCFEGMDDLEVNRVVISVDPNSDVFLGDLYQKLEKAELDKEYQLFGELKTKWRSRETRRYKEEWCDNKDPWFNGQIFNYTIIDAPHVGSLLTIEEIKNIVMNRYQTVPQ
ncbi:hypothetical protein [Neobacillus niacini]|uniref:hypothetical protein n=1 Tax=Neobacillus niacini TaxID=86668 RepID=UPI00203FBC9E|nr:hypothetical protein [Neobacillus niacini]MCM3691447.1 hypothetical protein [Neobacillus niacini]